MSIVADHTTMPPADGRTADALSAILESEVVEIGNGDSRAVLPPELHEVVRAAAEAFAAGRAVTVQPVRTHLTTQEAADLLGVSRPTLVALLEEGRIPFSRPGRGRHRKVMLEDVLTYQREVVGDRDAALAALGEEAADPAVDGFPRMR
ncbi:helix-turn-helix domain-containing protein [Tsukamurella sp. 1534]|uniref:helix-turn-helix domain-containing protein n=1 Tax=Tsukamurella sp. 1534 TaxID=1151061 RepID=UPI0003088876|nr:helix-turn-helix domain-containing protein [Tsukamurella sp. 1534]